MWYTISTKEVEKQMQTNIEFGLNEKQVEDKQNKFGLNKLEEKNVKENTKLNKGVN